jgi:hypothetical protein
VDELLPVLVNQMVEGGIHYDFKLSVFWHQKDGEWNVHITSVRTVQEHKPKDVYFPLWALQWLRQQMVKMLMEHDGSEQIDEKPTMPEWAKRGFTILKFSHEYSFTHSSIRWTKH